MLVTCSNNKSRNVRSARKTQICLCSQTIDTQISFSLDHRNVAGAWRKERLGSYYIFVNHIFGPAKYTFFLSFSLHSQLLKYNHLTWKSEKWTKWMGDLICVRHISPLGMNCFLKWRLLPVPSSYLYCPVMSSLSAAVPLVYSAQVSLFPAFFVHIYWPTLKDKWGGSYVRKQIVRRRLKLKS